MSKGMSSLATDITICESIFFFFRHSLHLVAPTQWGTCPHFYKWLGTGEQREKKNSKQETDQTVLTITKTFTKTTSCAFRAKKWRGVTNKFFPELRAGSVPPLLLWTGAPTFALDRCPHFCSGPVPPLSNSFRRH